MIRAADLIALFRQALEEAWGYIWGTSGTLWTAKDQENLEKTTDSDRAQGRKYGKKWIGKKVADCSGLFSWAFRKLGGYMYHGSDTMFRKYTTASGKLSKGKRTDGETLKPGTAVFIWKTLKQKYTHVGLYIGGDTVIEAAGTIDGVITSKASKKWTHWGELKGVDYSGPVPEVKPTLKKGSKGDLVKQLQEQLISLGYDLGKWGADGDFGSATLAAVKAFQKANGLTADGVVGVSTWEKLDNNPKKAPEKTYTVTITISGISKSEADALVMKYPGAKVKEE